MIRLILFVGFTGLLHASLPGQASTAVDLRRDIAFYADVLVNAIVPAHRERARAGLVASLEQLLVRPESGAISLDSIRGLSVLHGPDFRLVTWSHMVSDSAFQYGGFLQQGSKVTWFTDNRPFLNGSAYSVYTPEAWYGCLYYELIPFSRNGQTFYILLGFHAQDQRVNTKVADVLDLSNGQIRLGAPVFTGRDRVQSRLMLTYADVSTVHIRYDPELNAIVHDHLQDLPGVGPRGEPLPVADGSLEGWLFTQGDWQYRAEVYDVDVKEPPMTEERKNRKEEKDILGRPKK